MSVLLRGRARALVLAILASMTMAPAISSANDDLETAVAALARVGFAASPSFSPDGARIAFVSNLSGLPQVWTLPSTGGFPRQVTGLTDPVQGVAWSPDGEWLAFVLAPGGGMNAQVYLVKPDGTGLHRVTDGGKETNRLAGWTHDGRSLLLGSNRVDPRTIDGYLYDVATGPMRLVLHNKGVGGLVDVSRDGRRAVFQRVVSRGDANLYLLDLASGAETLLTPHQGPGGFGGGTFSPDGRTIYLRSDLDRDLASFARIALGADGKPGTIESVVARDDAELETYAVSEDGRTAAVVWNEGGRSALALVDLTAAARAANVSEVRDLPSDMVGDLAFSRDGRRLALAASGASSPRDLWVLDLASRQFTRLTESPHPGVALESLVRPELVRLPGHDSIELSGWLYRPPGVAAPAPYVLSFHGGPEGQERPFFNGTYQALLSRGIGVFAPNVRGSGGFGKRFVNLDNGALRHDGVRDLETCARWIASSGIGDPKRLGIMGGSYGGYMVMAGITRWPDLFAAGANLFGVVNFETFFAHTEPWMAAISTVEYGDPVAEAEMLRALSPIHAIDRVKTPTIVLHGANDTNVPVVEAEQVVENLKRRGVPVEYVLFPDEGHGFVRLENRIRSAVSIVRWFETHLK